MALAYTYHLTVACVVFVMLRTIDNCVRDGRTALIVAEPSVAGDKAFVWA